MLPNTSPWLDDADALQPWLADPAPLALDTEFMRERTYWPRLALIQLALDDRAALVDPLAFPALATLGAALADPARTVLMHSAGEDLVALRPLLPAPMLGLYDTQIAAAFAGLGPGLGYQGLVERLFEVRLGKGETRSDWLARPLSEAQLHYAIDDVRYLGAAYERLHAVLEERGYADWHREDCRRLARATFAAEIDPQPQLGFRGLWRWPPPALAQLRRMLIWRDEAARERDLPRRWVLDDDTAIAVAIEPAHSGARLVDRLAQGPAGRRRSLAPLLALLERPPSEEEIEQTDPIPAPQEAAQRQQVKALKAIVDAEAARLDLPPGLLCPRRALDALTTKGQWPADFAGWREDVLLPKLQALL